ncbi:hypothetical protein AVEN_179501-1 [Araneus ventricosus]|uniref:Uncharacterized protein n=1 Tax=Araneus ventricosus TaxID=182803 RepID=A0A4Y2IWK3_ARAVE|nr:hypothetical protein AVEN_179501-1 [Araneus ventricosus]
MILQLTTLLTPIFHNIMCLIRVPQIGRSDNVVDNMLVAVVSILDTERYCLQMLLLRKSGAVSFDDILTANGLRCITFQQACQVYGLLQCFQQWHVALNEAAQFQSPRQLRMLFI